MLFFSSFLRVETNQLACSARPGPGREPNNACGEAEAGPAVSSQLAVSDSDLRTPAAQVESCAQPGQRDPVQPIVSLHLQPHYLKYPALDLLGGEYLSLSKL